MLRTKVFNLSDSSQIFWFEPDSNELESDSSQNESFPMNLATMIWNTVLPGGGIGIVLCFLALAASWGFISKICLVSLMISIKSMISIKLSPGTCCLVQVQRFGPHGVLRDLDGAALASLGSRNTSIHMKLINKLPLIFMPNHKLGRICRNNCFTVCWDSVPMPRSS